MHALFFEKVLVIFRFWAHKTCIILHKGVDNFEIEHKTYYFGGLGVQYPLKKKTRNTYFELQKLIIQKIVHHN